jgi:hypothetical protein
MGFFGRLALPAWPLLLICAIARCAAQHTGEWKCHPPDFDTCGTDPKIFFLDPATGSDDNNGLTPATPFLTLGHAFSLAATDPKSPFHFRLAGGYYGGFEVGPKFSDDWPQRGDHGWVHFQATTTNDGPNPAMLSHVDIGSPNNPPVYHYGLVLRGFKINGTKDGGSWDNNAIRISYTRAVRIHDCLVSPQNTVIWEDYNSGPRGIVMQGALDVIVSNSTVVGGQYGVTFDGGGNLTLLNSNVGFQFGDAVRLSGSRDVSLVGNHIHHVWDYQQSGEHLDGIQLFAKGPAGKYPQPSYVLIESNLIVDMPGQMIFVQSNWVDMIGHIHDIVVRNNILGPQNDPSSWAIPLQMQRVENFTLEHNTIAESAQHYASAFIRDGSSGHLTGNILGGLGVMLNSTLYSRSDFNVIDNFEMDGTSTVELGGNTVVDSTTTFSNPDFYDFSPTTIDACTGGADGRHAGAVPCRVCEWNSTKEVVALFAIHPPRVSIGSNGVVLHQKQA